MLLLQEVARIATTAANQAEPLFTDRQIFGAVTTALGGTLVIIGKHFWSTLSGHVSQCNAIPKKLIIERIDSVNTQLADLKAHIGTTDSKIDAVAANVNILVGRQIERDRSGETGMGASAGGGS